MALSFYTDHSFNDYITRGVVERGLDCLTARADGRRQADDDVLLERATGLQRVLLTHDEDFLEIASHWQNAGKTFAGIVFVPQMRVSIGAAIADIELIGKLITHEEMINRVEWLPLCPG